MRILTINDKKDNKFLRKKVSSFNFDSTNRGELHKLVGDMKKTMQSADGVGLAANQIGISSSFFVAEFDRKFYAIFNPEIIKKSEEEDVMEEGCLSIPGGSGKIKRASEITIKGYDKNGKRVKMRAWGNLARIFQHEVDHLSGKLFIDYVKERQITKFK